MGSELDFPQTEKYSDSLKIWFSSAALCFLSRAQLGKVPDTSRSLKTLILGRAARVLVSCLLIRMGKSRKLLLYLNWSKFCLSPSSFLFFCSLPCN